MTHEELFIDLFKPSDTAVGERQPTGKIRQKDGKVEDNMFTKRRQATVNDFTEHFAGRKGVGLPPIHSNSKCCWGAIDVDTEVYGRDLEVIARAIYTCYPFLQVARTKSGGIHIFLFLDDFIPAEKMVPTLNTIAANLGYAGTEIFPKQRKIQNTDGILDCGNWLNLPYFGGDNALNYGIDINGKAIPTVEDFYKEATRRKTDIKFVESYSPPQYEDGSFSDGPPCLQAIWANGVEQNRNDSLTGAATYCQKKYPDDWQKQLKMFNTLMVEPLPEKEVDAMITSYTKESYQYSCKKSPLCNHCNQALCFERPHGIGNKEDAPPFTGNRSLTKIETDPPRWAVDVEKENGWERVTCSTEELQSALLFQRRCMEEINTAPPIPNRTTWTKGLQKLLSDVTIIPVDHADTREGRLMEILNDWIENTVTTDKKSLPRVPYFDGDNYFIHKGRFEEHLKVTGFKITDHEFTAFLKTTMKAESTVIKILGKSHRLWKLPDSYELNQMTELPVTNIEEPF